MQPVRLLRLFTLVVSAFVVAALAAFTWSDYAASTAEGERSLREVARLMEEHTRTAMLVSTVQLNRVAEMVGDRPMTKLRGSQADWLRLRSLMAEIPHADSIWLFDNNADLMLSTLKPSGVTLNVADREYFTSVRDGTTPLFISPRIWGKLYGGYYLAMSRAIQDAKGAFRGVVQFSIKESYFSDFYRSLRPEGGASFTILKTDGSLVARYPAPLDGSKLSPGRVLNVIQTIPEGETVMRTMISEHDGIDRIYALRKVANYPLVVAAGLPRAVIFGGFRERTLRNVGLGILALGAFLVISWQLTHAFLREDAALTKAQTLLSDKEVLFQEIHHRVKNNLQIISSFLTMQAIKAKDATTAEAFHEALDRIQSMGLVHQILYEQNEAAEVSMDAYLRALATSVGQSYGAAERAITIDVITDGTRLGLDRAVPLALLANEALTNAMKHAFPAGRSGTIEMRLEHADGQLAFQIRDDGVGIPEARTEAGSGLGMHILKALASQLDGTARFSFTNGTALRVDFPA